MSWNSRREKVFLKNVFQFYSSYLDIELHVHYTRVLCALLKKKKHNDSEQQFFFFVYFLIYHYNFIPIMFRRSATNRFFIEYDDLSHYNCNNIKFQVHIRFWRWHQRNSEQRLVTFFFLFNDFLIVFEIFPNTDERDARRRVRGFS